MYEIGILILTHSSRTIDLKQCSKEFFIQRYSNPGRLSSLVPFEDLPPINDFQSYTAQISFFRILETKGNCLIFTYCGSITSNRKIQHAVFLNDKDLLVAFESGLELWRAHQPIGLFKRITANCFVVQKQYDHPHLSGVHTVFQLPGNRVAISASAPDAVLILNLRTKEIEKKLRMPEEIYGSNYNLTEEMDLREHYIHNDCQTTHINCAYPMNSGHQLVVSTLIQGAIGVFDLKNDNYEELTRGFIGCHSSRVNDDGQIYFADSVSGSLIFLDQKGNMSKKFSVDSRWLHDVQQIKGDIYAFSISDLNELRVYNIETGELLFRKKFWRFPVDKFKILSRLIPGSVQNSTQFLSCYPLES
jgi:WD40 repeat protein